MTVDPANIRSRLQSCELRRLFLEELGWDRSALLFDVTLIEPGQRGLGPKTSANFVPPAQLETRTFALHAIAAKRGFTVLHCRPQSDGSIPNPSTRFWLQHRVAKSVRENIIVYTDARRTTQIWQWARRGHDGPTTICEHTFTVTDTEDEVVDRLALLAVNMAEEESESITLAVIAERVSTAFYEPRKHIKRGPYRSGQLSDAAIEQLDDGLRWWFRYVQSLPRLGRREELRLAQAVHQGDIAAKNRLIEANLYLVVGAAWKAKPRGGAGLTTVSDLIQEGNLGLIRAIEKFDPRQGVRLQSYASIWIRRSIDRSLLDVDALVHLPMYLHDVLASITPHYEIEADRLRHRLEREPSHDEVLERFDLSPQQRETIRLLPVEIVPLASPLETGEWAYLSERIRDGLAFSVERIVLEAARRRIINKMIGKLTGREAEVIRQRFGFSDGYMATLEEVGLRLHVTRERVRQIERRALEKLSLLIPTDEMRDSRPILPGKAAKSKPAPQNEPINA